MYLSSKGLPRVLKVVRSRFTDELLTASFCNARATAEYIEHFSPSEVSFIISGLRPGGWGDEDQTCADYIKAQLSQNEVDPESYLQRVRESTPGQLFQDPELPEYPSKDLEYCLTVNKFDFVMPVQRTGEHLLMRPSKL